MTGPVRHATPFATLRAVRERATEAVLGQSGLSHPALAAEIRRLFTSTDVEGGSLMGEPVIEAAPPFVQADTTLGRLAGTLLHPEVVDILTHPDAERRHVFSRELRPYRHQLECWTKLTGTEPRSVLVTSGTGSGKTECFLVPLLDDLAREAEAGRLSGVRAIALYPLNALIASQQERLSEWTRPFEGRVRFGLYNGAMESDEPEERKRACPEQVIDRRTLRADPPPILVTNLTMLEYMTVRRQDRPLIERSRRKLRWIVLDEAHSYVGSAAAEVALLIRRVLLAFDVRPETVRFVATSATIGEGPDVVGKLKRFLADVSGTSPDRVDVVVGERRAPELPSASGSGRLTEADLLDARAVGRSPVTHALARRLAQPTAWRDFVREAGPAGVDPEALALALTRKETGGEPLIPLRIHGFLRAVPGLWACLDPACPGRPEGEWPVGAVLPHREATCPHCTSAVVEIVSCAECGEPCLSSVERDGRLQAPPRSDEVDEFAAGREKEDEPEEDEDADKAADEPERRPDVSRLFALRTPPGGRPIHVEFATGAVVDKPGERTVTLSCQDPTTPETCPACAAVARKGSGRGALLRPFRYGAPFLIGNAAPVLLDGVEPPPLRPDPKASAPPPSGGRQLLSFTDSRQGTARFAASLQAASERSQVRALVYHSVQDSTHPPPGAAEKAAALDALVQQLETSKNRAFDALISEKKAERAKLAGSIDGIAWPELRRQLAQRPEVAVWLRAVWRERDRRFVDETAFAEFLLLRELARRPVRANALETLGLARLRFDAIDGLGEARLPGAFRERGLTLADWRDFLYAMLTVSVRGQFAIRMAKPDVRWLIRHGFAHTLLPPHARDKLKGQLSWPSARAIGRPANVVRLLEAALKLDAGDARDRAVLNGLLEESWDRLVPLFNLPGAGDQRQLDLAQAHVAPVRDAFLCARTRRLLDRAFACLSPFGLARSGAQAGAPCERVAMPVHPNPHLLPEGGGVATVEAWLRDDPTIAALRGRGLWTDLHDRIALGAPYARSAEHSAQQAPELLRSYEGEFKAGRINILSCSTTMEMGVDIGTVQSVMMTNVPPSIANYRQRVGRAGRRGQGFATSLTYARDTPLDREAFRAPALYLARSVETPRVSLDSRRIVQRHVTAHLLASWFRDAKGEALRAKAGAFFGCPAAPGEARPESWPSRAFRDWLALPSTATAMVDALAILVRGSALERDPHLREHAAEAVREAEDAFVQEWSLLREQAAALGRDTARKAVEIELKRLCDEFLLGDLADRGVLPGYGFPTHVAEFVNAEKPAPDETQEKEGARGRRRSYPSRNLDIALREYAPGAEVVVDGLVYRSAGVTLNWRRPAGESEVREIQSLKWFWTCPGCRASDVSRLRPESCDACGAALGERDRQRFLEPKGFTVDFQSPTHADIEQVDYIEPEPERVSIRGEPWRRFLVPELGRLRAGHDGLVFHSSRGPGRGGYAVCLECGRAEALAGRAADAKPLEAHRPLRFTKAGPDKLCPGNGKPFAIQANLALGHDVRTDVAEVQPQSLPSADAAWALASALRTGLSRRLGIETRELGLAVSPRDTPQGGLTHSVFLFDQTVGGAGYAVRLLDLFDEVLGDAKDVLACGRGGCVRGCSACVLAPDLYSRAETIDRIGALACVEEILAASAAPAGPDAVAPGARLVRNAADVLLGGGSDAVTIWAGEAFDPAGLATEPLASLLSGLAAGGRPTTLAVTAAALGSLDPAARLSLRDATVRHGLKLATGTAPRFGAARAIASTADGRLLASRDQAAATVGPSWGLGTSAPILAFDAAVGAPTPLDPRSLLPAAGAGYRDIKGDLNGASASVGRRFAALLRPLLAEQGLWRPGALASLRYSDRYVRSPFVAHLAWGAATALAAALAPPGEPIPFRLELSPLGHPDERAPWAVVHDWRVEADRRQALVRLFSDGPLTLQIAVGDRPHSRRLELVYPDAVAAVLLDQGFGFLQPARRLRHDFAASPDAQARAIAEMDVPCAASGPTFVVVTPAST